MNNKVILKVANQLQSNFDWKLDTVCETNIKNQVDNRSDFIINTNNSKIKIEAEYHKMILPSAIPNIKLKIESNTKKNKAKPLLFLSNYISTKSRTILKSLDINYVDTAGNMFFKHENIYIYLEVGSSDRALIANNNGRAFTKTGLKVIYQFLKNEKNEELLKPLINFPYREIASEAGVSIDTVSKVIKDLLDQGYLLKKDEKLFTFINKEKLLEKWVDGFNSILRPSLKQGKYRSIDNAIKMTNGFPADYNFGGYAAAHHYNLVQEGNQLINPDYLIYTFKGFKDIPKDFRLIPDENGNITVIEAFWKEPKLDNGERYSSAVDYYITYADLVNSDDPRMQSVAALVYKSLEVWF